MNTYELQCGPSGRCDYTLTATNNLAALECAQELIKEDGVEQCGRYPQMFRIAPEGYWVPLSGPKWLLDGQPHPEVANY